MRTRRFVPVALALALAAGALLTLPALARPQATAAAWEYAELRISGNDAYVYYAQRIIYLEGPARLNPQSVEGRREVELVPNPALLHLDRVGREGWEAVPSEGGPGAGRFLLKRAK